MNRFTKDIGNMDDQVPQLLFDPIWVIIEAHLLLIYTAHGCIYFNAFRLD